MPNMTLAIPEDLKKEMDMIPEINWSEVARKAIKEKAEEYKLFKNIQLQSKKIPYEYITKKIAQAEILEDTDPQDIIDKLRERRLSK